MRTLYFFALETLTKVREMWAVAKIRALGQNLINKSSVLADTIESEGLVVKSQMKELRADPTNYEELDEVEISSDPVGQQLYLVLSSTPTSQEKSVD